MWGVFFGIVLFFPQMRPEKVAQNASKDYEKAGVRADLVPILQKLGILTIEELKKANANKLFNDVCGMRNENETRRRTKTLRKRKLRGG